MSNPYVLLNSLKPCQREMIIHTAEFDMLPLEGVLRRIAELENAIAAVEAVAGEEADKARRS